MVKTIRKEFLDVVTWEMVPPLLYKMYFWLMTSNISG